MGDATNKKPSLFTAVGVGDAATYVGYAAGSHYDGWSFMDAYLNTIPGWRDRLAEVSANE